MECTVRECGLGMPAAAACWDFVIKHCADAMPRHYLLLPYACVAPQGDWPINNGFAVKEVIELIKSHNAAINGKRREELDAAASPAN